MRRAAFERWSAVLGGGALAGIFYYYVTIWVNPRTGGPALDGFIRDIVLGRQEAPFQYRVLVPAVLVWLNDHTSLSMGQATVLVDGTAMAVGAVVGFALLRRVGDGIYALPVALYCAFVGIGIVLYSKPETITAFACVTIALVALDRRSSNWWTSRVVWVSLTVAMLVLLGCRTDLVFAISIGFGARWWQRRARADAVAAVVLALAAVGASVALIARYPDARYGPEAGVIQLQHNADALVVIVACAFLLPVLAPLLTPLRYPQTSAPVRSVAAARLPALAVVAAEIVATFVVGRIDEIRLFFPLAFLLAWVGLDLWRALLSTIEVEDVPRSMTGR